MVGAPRKAHKARKVSGSLGRPPPRNEALGWPLAHLAWADLRLMRDSGRPASPAHPSCSWGREEDSLGGGAWVGGSEASGMTWLGLRVPHQCLGLGALETILGAPGVTASGGPPRQEARSPVNLR